MSQTKLILLMMQNILKVKIQLKDKIMSDKTLKDKAYEIATNRGYDGFQRALASMAYKFWIKRQDQE